MADFWPSPSHRPIVWPVPCTWASEFGGRMSNLLLEHAFCRGDIGTWCAGIGDGAVRNYRDSTQIRGVDSPVLSDLGVLDQGAIVFDHNARGIAHLRGR